jgi:DNA-directed RNA polymerase subunit RPC12/RpoP
VIRFKCIYCGQRILAREDGVGKKGKCPKCGHELVVPKSTKGRPAISVEKTEPMQFPKDAADRRAPSFTKSRDLPEYQRDDQAEIYEEKAGWFIPIYDELALFLMAITLILLCIANSSMREQIHKWMATHHYIWLYIVAAIFLCGLGLSIYHVFTTREKTDAEKWGMLIFAVLTNAVTGIISGWYVIKNNAVHNWLLVFPIWNIVNGALLLLMLRFKIIDEECISDRDATATEVVLGLIAVLVIFILCNYVFKLYWAITFSICIVYTTSFDRALQSIFPGMTADETQQTS